MKESRVNEITFVIPTYERPLHFIQYYEAGFWNDVCLKIALDGSTSAVAAEAASIVGSDRIIHFQNNRGQAIARHEALGHLNTPLVSYCDEDDFIQVAGDYAVRAEAAFRDERTILFTPRQVIAFSDGTSPKVQYDRLWANNRTGLNFLNYVVETGEIHALGVSTFRVEELLSLGTPVNFRTGEDFVLLARLAARRPEGMIRVDERSSYVRRIHDDSITSRKGTTVRDMVQNTLAMVVAGYHLITLGEMDRDRLASKIRTRAVFVESCYGMGREVAEVIAGLVTGGTTVGHERETLETLEVLEELAPDLPWELVEMFTPGKMPPVSATSFRRELRQTEVLEDDTDQVAFLVRFYDRLIHFQLYLALGYWDGVHAVLYCDGSTEAYVDELRRLTTPYTALEVVHSRENHGIGVARKYGARANQRPYTAMCDDDDFILDARAFANTAAALFSEQNVCMVAFPWMQSVDNGFRPQHTWDRRTYDGISMTVLLRAILESGQVNGLGVSVFRTSDLCQMDADPVFRHAEDIASLSRLTELHPDGILRVPAEGTYMRLAHANAVSQAYDVRRCMLAMWALTIAASVLRRLGVPMATEPIQYVYQRGLTIQHIYGVGAGVVRVWQAFMEDVDIIPSNQEEEEASAFLNDHYAEIPSEIIRYKSLLAPVPN